MKKLLIFLCFCVVMIISSSTTAKAEEGVAGISVTLDKVNKIEAWTTTNVNLRSKPNTNSDIITTLTNDTKIQKLSISDDWTMVVYEDKTGWVYSKYIRDTETTVIEFTDKELEILYKIVEAEATGESIESKENVASSIINRLYDSNFPSTIKEVVFQKEQYSPIGDRRYYTVTVTEETKEAVHNVIKNGVTHDCIYFCNYDNVTSSKLRRWFDNALEFVFKDDSNHSYYVEKKEK